MKLIEEHQMKNILSTCCPAVVTYVEKNFPELVDQLAPVVSPMIAHGYDLKERYPGVKTVFLTPCIAKQKEAADPRFAGAIDAVLTMPDLSVWLKDEPVNEDEEQSEVRWESLKASTVRMYPTPGGVIRTLSSSDEVYERVSAEGMDRVRDALKSIAQGHMEGYFFELSACEQSCLGGHCYAMSITANGERAARSGATWIRRIRCAWPSCPPTCARSGRPIQSSGTRIPKKKLRTCCF